MKNLLVILVCVFIAGSASAQELRGKATKKKDLSNHEIVLTTNGILPALRYNYYFNGKTILHIEKVKTGVFQDRDQYMKVGGSVWLERRKYLGRKVFFSHGFSAATFVERTNLEIPGDEPSFEVRPTYTLGYGIGGGFKIKDRITIATKINPTLSVNKDGVDFRTGGFLQTFGNLYLGYRF